MTERPAKNACKLVPINLHNQEEFDELLRQRIICGWDNLPTNIEALRKEADAQTMTIFWIVPLSSTQGAIEKRYAGHIMGSIRSEGPKDDPAAASKLSMHIFNLFILPEYRLGGYGRAAIMGLESWAKIKAPELQAITLNTIDRRYTEDDSEEWGGMYSRYCKSNNIAIAPIGASNEDWYARMGFVKYSEQPMYPITFEGRDILLGSVSMKKSLV